MQSKAKLAFLQNNPGLLNNGFFPLPSYHRLTLSSQPRPSLPFQNFPSSRILIMAKTPDSHSKNAPSSSSSDVQSDSTMSFSQKLKAFVKSSPVTQALLLQCLFMITYAWYNPNDPSLQAFQLALRDLLGGSVDANQIASNFASLVKFSLDLNSNLIHISKDYSMHLLLLPWFFIALL